MPDIRGVGKQPTELFVTPGLLGCTAPARSLANLYALPEIDACERYHKIAIPDRVLRLIECSHTRSTCGSPPQKNIGTVAWRSGILFRTKCRFFILWSLDSRSREYSVPMKGGPHSESQTRGPFVVEPLAVYTTAELRTGLGETLWARLCALRIRRLCQGRYFGEDVLDAIQQLRKSSEWFSRSRYSAPYKKSSRPVHVESELRNADRADQIVSPSRNRLHHSSARRSSFARVQIDSEREETLLLGVVE